MREPHAEGGSDSTVTPNDGLAAREGRSQAFTGVRAGQLLSRENLIDRGADVVVDTEGNIANGASASRSGTPRGRREPVHARNLHVGEPGDPMYARPHDHRPGRPGKAEAARLGWTSWGVVSARSTKEAAEQISVRGEPGHAQAEAGAVDGRGRTKARGDQQTTLRTLSRHTSVACAGSHAPTTGQGVGALIRPSWDDPEPTFGS